MLIGTSRAGSPSAPEIDTIEAEQVLVAGGHDALAFAKPVEHLDALRIAPAEAHRAPHGVGAGGVDDEDPATAGVVVERAVRDDEAFRRLADVEAHPHGLPAAEQCRRVARELELDLELAVAHVRIDLRDLERVLAACELERRDLAERDARQVILVDERRDLERALLVDLPDALAGRLRFADVRVEQREVAGDRRGDHEILEVLARDLEIAVHRVERLAEPVDLRGLKRLVDLLRLEHGRAQLAPVRELRLELVELLAGRAAVADERLAPRDPPREPVDLVIELDQLAPMAQPVLLERQARAAQAVELLRELRFAPDDLELQIRVLQADERLSRFDDGAGFRIDVGDLAALDGVEINGRSRHDVSRHRDVIAKRAVGDGRERQPVGSDVERAVQAEPDVRIARERDECEKGGPRREPGRGHEPTLERPIHRRERNGLVGMLPAPEPAQFGDAHRLVYCGRNTLILQYNE